MNLETENATSRRDFLRATCRNTALAGMAAWVALEGLKRRRLGTAVVCWTPRSCWDCAQSLTCPRSMTLPGTVDRDDKPSDQRRSAVGRTD